MRWVPRMPPTPHAGTLGYWVQLGRVPLHQLAYFDGEWWLRTEEGLLSGAPPDGDAKKIVLRDDTPVFVPAPLKVLPPLPPIARPPGL